MYDLTLHTVYNEIIVNFCQIIYNPFLSPIKLIRLIFNSSCGNLGKKLSLKKSIEISLTKRWVARFPLLYRYINLENVQNFRQNTFVFSKFPPLQNYDFINNGLMKMVVNNQMLLLLEFSNTYCFLNDKAFLNRKAKIIPKVQLCDQISHFD